MGAATQFGHQFWAFPPTAPGHFTRWEAWFARSCTPMFVKTKTYGVGTGAALQLAIIRFAAAFQREQCSAQPDKGGKKVNYSDMLLKQIRELNDELDQYVEPANPEEVARREELLQALAWYVHKLQMRMLSGPCAANVSSAAPGYWAQGPAQRRATASHAGA